jgi:hypothetical protein
MRKWNDAKPKRKQIKYQKEKKTKLLFEFIHRPAQAQMPSLSLTSRFCSVIADFSFADGALDDILDNIHSHLPWPCFLSLSIH